LGSLRITCGTQTTTRSILYLKYTWARELVPKFKLSGNKALLDVGCDDGKVTAILAKCLPKGYVVGVDSSEDMINSARRTFSLEAYPNLSFQRMNAAALTFQARFDRVFSNAVLHWILDHKSVLQCVQRSMKSGGRLLFQMGGKGNAQEILAILDGLFREEPWMNSLRASVFPIVFTRPKSTWFCYMKRN
jgi:trans-aconitate 2-methyltransferase